LPKPKRNKQKIYQLESQFANLEAFFLCQQKNSLSKISIDKTSLASEFLIFVVDVKWRVKQPEYLPYV